MLPPLKPIPIKECMSVVFVEKGEIDVVDGAFVVVDNLRLRVRPVLTHIPVAGVACLMPQRRPKMPLACLRLCRLRLNIIRRV
jgi:hypothetical protein